MNTVSFESEEQFLVKLSRKRCEKCKNVLWKNIGKLFAHELAEKEENETKVSPIQSSRYQRIQWHVSL